MSWEIKALKELAETYRQLFSCRIILQTCKYKMTAQSLDREPLATPDARFSANIGQIYSRSPAAYSPDYPQY